MRLDRFEAFLFDEQHRRRTPVEAILHSKHRDDIIAAIPDQVTYLGAGLDAIVFAVSDTEVVRAGRRADRPPIAEVLQAIDTRYFGEAIMVERLPRCSLDSITDTEIEDCCGAIATHGLWLSDDQNSNFGRHPDGRICLLDPTQLAHDYFGNGAEPASRASVHEGHAITLWRGRWYLQSHGKTWWYRPSAFAEVQHPTPRFYRVITNYHGAVVLCEPLPNRR